MRTASHRYLPMRLFSLLVSVVCITSGFADQPQAVFGTRQFVEYLPGSLPVVIGAPHGGALKPDDLPDRKDGKVVKDAFTQELARLIRADMIARFGAAPHLIICRLHRSKLDCNREVVEAAQGSPQAVQAYEEFHAWITRACDSVQKNDGAGLYLDLHGHRHEHGLVEIGMLVPATKLALSDAGLDAGDFIARQSSLRELDQRSPQTFSSLIRGAQSLGGLLEARGFASIPSPAHPSPEGGPYYNGAYSIETHGSRRQGSVSAVQIECPFENVRQTEEKRKKFSEALCESLDEFFRVHFGRSLKTTAPAR